MVLAPGLGLQSDQTYPQRRSDPVTAPPSGQTVPPSGQTVLPSGQTVLPSGQTVPPFGRMAELLEQDALASAVLPRTGSTVEATAIVLAR